MKPKIKVPSGWRRARNLARVKDGDKLWDYNKMRFAVFQCLIGTRISKNQFCIRKLARRPRPRKSLGLMLQRAVWKYPDSWQKAAEHFAREVRSRGGERK